MKHLRIIDANFNRAREALRVLEDYARFVAEDAGASVRLKHIRHTLTQCITPILPAALAWRDTENDLGTTTKTPAELTRQDEAQVVSAAAGRLGESLRALEEFCKIDHASAAAQIESLRYQGYVLGQALQFHADGALQALRWPKPLVCVLITESVCKQPWQQVAEASLKGGAGVLQLREKNLEGKELLARATWLSSLCKQHGAQCIINDRPDIALLSGASGVHLGQGDIPPDQARKIIGSRLILGVSTHSLADISAARKAGAHYVGFGPVFRSPTKPRDILPGLPALKEAAMANPDFPLLAIAGISHENAAQVRQTGVQRVAVTSCVTACDDPADSVKKLLASLA